MNNPSFSVYHPGSDNPICESETDVLNPGQYYSDVHIDDKPYRILVDVADLKWQALSTELNRKGFFTRITVHDGVDALEVCKPNEDIFSYDLAQQLRNPNITLTLVASQGMWFVRITERQKARW